MIVGPSLTAPALSPPLITACPASWPEATLEIFPVREEQQPAIVANCPGAGSTAAPARVATSPADGYTLLVNTSAHAYSAVLASDLPYDGLKDFVAVNALTSQPYVLVTGAWTGITTVAELIDAGHAAHGRLRFASAGLGTGTHLAVMKLNRDAGITAVHVPAGPTDAIADVIDGTAAGHTAYALSPIPIAVPHLDDGDLVALGVSTARRSVLLPDVPPLTAAGVPGFDFPIWYGIWAPAQTPAAIIDKIARDVGYTLAKPELLEWLMRHDAAPMIMTRAEFAAFVISESRWAARLISASN